MRDLRPETVQYMTGLSGADWLDEHELEMAELVLTDPGRIVEMTEEELHLLPMALSAVRSARSQLEAV